MQPKPRAVIFDVDGTLVNTSDIVHLVLAKPKKYDQFHYASVFCDPHDWVVELARKHFIDGDKVIIVTARKYRWLDITCNWLEGQQVPYHEIHMRKDDDDRKDRIVKEEILAKLQEKYEIVHAYDDNPAVIELWEEYAIPVTVVPGWAG
jgi:beta-phosphoglucomutase-like phosphatase (HAD superfamily)